MAEGKMVVVEYDGMERNHPVKVVGERGEFRFRFAVLRDGKCESVCVVGGTKSRIHFRHFAPERIVKKKVRS